MKATLFALASILVATPVHGTPGSPREAFNFSEVVDAVSRAGFSVTDKDARCSYVYGSTLPESRRFIVCVDNHRTVSELKDTIRHEAVHVAQTCNGGPLYTPHSIYAKAKDSQLWSLREYPKHVRVREIEAQVLAANSTDQDIVQLLARYC
jgi:hypothetical protein